VRVHARNYDRTVAIETPAGAITLGHPAAERVWIKPLAEREPGVNTPE